jgi:uncharacterized membrane protein
MSFFGNFGEWINQNPGKAAGAMAGLVLGVLIFTIGPLKVLVVILFILAGYIIGKSRDEKKSLIDTAAGLFKRKDE